MRIPPFLQSGDKAVILAPARKVSPEEMAPAFEALKQWGLEAVPSANLYGSHHQYSGTDAQRLADLQAAFDDPDVRLILCGRGGYGTLRILDGLDLTQFKKHPKWLVGFSDLTALHIKLYNAGLASMHGPMAISWNGKTADAASIAYLRDSLFGWPQAITTTAAHPELARTGTATGRLVGGNLSMISQLLGTASDMDTKGCILFLEDLDEYLYHVDRMMLHLQRAGKLKQITGLIVGGFTELKDNATPYGQTAEEIILEKVAGMDIPVCFGFPVGHWPANRSLIHGAKVRLNVSHAVSELVFLEEK